MLKMNGMPFDYRDEWDHRAVYHMTNRIHDGEVWLAYRDEQGRLRFTSQTKIPAACELLGEIECVTLEDGRYEFDIKPVQERDAVELGLRARRAEAHKAYRQELYKRYSFADRLRDLSTPNKRS